MPIELKKEKEDECCCCNKDRCCASGAEKRRVEFINHLGNIFWLLFFLALIFSNWTVVIALFIAAMICEEFD